jgi:hypothetical protein
MASMMVDNDAEQVMTAWRTKLPVEPIGLDTQTLDDADQATAAWNLSQPTSHGMETDNKECSEVSYGTRYCCDAVDNISKVDMSNAVEKHDLPKEKINEPSVVCACHQ